MNLNQGTLKAFSQNKIGIFNPDFNGNSSHFLVLVRYLALLPGALAFFFSNSKEIQQLCYVLFPWVLGEGPTAFLEDDSERPLLLKGWGLFPTCKPAAGTPLLKKGVCKWAQKAKGVLITQGCFSIKYTATVGGRSLLQNL